MKGPYARNLRPSFLLLALTLLQLAAPAATAQGVAPAREPETAAIARRIEELTNQARAGQGLPPALHVAYLGTAADGHSQEMLTMGYFSHTSPVAQQATPKQRILQSGGWDSEVGENIYKCSGISAEQVAQRTVEAWLASPAHYRNLMNPAYNSQGVGVARSGDTFTVTQNFSKQSFVVVQARTEPGAAGLQVVLKGRIREGSPQAAVFVNGSLRQTFQAAANGEFETRFAAPANAQISLGQQKSANRYSLTLILPSLTEAMRTAQLGQST
jgi:uncharacterized protein YkwD